MRREEGRLVCFFMICVFSNFAGIFDFGFLTPASQTSKTEAYSYELTSVSGDNKVTGHIQDLSSFFPLS